MSGFKTGLSAQEALQGLKDGLLTQVGFLHLDRDKWPKTEGELLQRFKPILVQDEDGDKGIVWEEAVQ